MVFGQYLHPADHNPAKIRKVNKMFESKLDLRISNIKSQN